MLHLVLDLSRSVNPLVRKLKFKYETLFHLFTKMFKPLVSRWRSLGIFIILYLDDGIFGCRTLPDAQLASNLVKSDVLNSGWRCNGKKSNWEPRQSGEWLGVIMLFVVPEKKIVKLKSNVIIALH